MSQNRKRATAWSRSELEASPAESDLPLAKRTRHQAPSASFHNRLHGTPGSLFTNQKLAKYLSILDKDQLIQVILQLNATENTDMQKSLFALIPKPTLSSVTKYLNGLEKKFMDAFPYSKHGRSHNEYAFHRVNPVLLEIQVPGVILFYSCT
jgi:hypothetical protein